MIRRYFQSLANSAYTYVASNALTSSTSSTATFAIGIKGPKLCNVTYKVTLYNASPGATMSINSTNYNKNDTFSIALDSSGNSTLTQVLNVGTSAPNNGINVIVTIISVSIGSISATFNNFANEKIT